MDPVRRAIITLELNALEKEESKKDKEGIDAWTKKQRIKAPFSG